MNGKPLRPSSVILSPAGAKRSPEQRRRVCRRISFQALRGVTSHVLCDFSATDPATQMRATGSRGQNGEAGIFPLFMSFMFLLSISPPPNPVNSVNSVFSKFLPFHSAEIS